MRVTLHPGAQADVSAAAEFYELDGSARLAARFVAELHTNNGKLWYKKYPQHTNRKEKRNRCSKVICTAKV